MRKYLYPILAILIVVVLYYTERYANKQSKEYPNTSKEVIKRTSEEFSGSWLPTSTTGIIIEHGFFTLSYSENHEQAEWVAYPLLKEHISSNEFKRPYFIEDREIETKSADWRSYKNSGFDRGHLCPAADRLFSYEAFHETFLTSNISPQNKEFNSGIWNKLEQQTRRWAKKYDGVYVVTGGVLKENLNRIGYEKVSVPEYFYKIIVDFSDKKPKAIAFIIPNQATSNSFYEYVTTIDEIEEITGIDFFSEMDAKTQNALESKLEYKW